MGTKCYAYQIALKTLKERCSYLQNKLESVEEENCQLKLQIPQDFMKKSPRSIQDIVQLQEEITLLTEQKDQLKHQIQLVTAENQKLWSRLSRFTSTNDTFGSNQDSHSCLEEHISYTDNNSDVEVSKIISPECNRESLEEISLKLNGIVLEVQGDSGRSGYREIQKGEIQQGEIKSPFSNVIDVKADNSSIQMETFAFSTSDDTGAVLSSFKNHILKLKQIKQVLLNNNNDLTSGITLFKNFQKNNLCGKAYSISNDANAVGHEEQRENDFSTLQVHEIGIGNCEHILNVGDRTCPLCEVVFSGSFEEFSEHVNGHFSEEEVDVTAGFELLQ